MAQVKNGKVTKAQRFADIKALLKGEEVSYGTDLNAAFEFIDHEVELLARKNSPNEKKAAEEKAKNDKLKEAIKDFLMRQEEGVTVTQVQKSVPELDDYSAQKIARLMGEMFHADEISKAIVKGRSLYSAK